MSASFRAGLSLRASRRMRRLSPAPLYAKVLNSAWHDLPAEIRAMHDVEHDRRRERTAPLSNADRDGSRVSPDAIIGFPPASDDVPVSVRFDVAHGIRDLDADIR